MEYNERISYVVDIMMQHEECVAGGPFFECAYFDEFDCRKCWEKWLRKDELRERE